MRGDFSRDSFDPSQHFSRVLAQQGRVQLDADINEQTSILLHYLRTLATDLIGPYGGPEAAAGFEILLQQDSNAKLTDLTVGPGRYYVDGILCENGPPPAARARPTPRDAEAEVVQLTPRGTSYFHQPDLPAPDKLLDPPFLVYLDVWERHLTAVEQPAIREPALGLNGPDTTTRTQIVWQIRIIYNLPDDLPIPTNAEDPEQIQALRDAVREAWDSLLLERQPTNNGRLLAWTDPAGPDATDLCISAPTARYRGAENQLYRVEIHTGGKAETATFKWSRDNGSAVFPIAELHNNDATLVSLGADLSSRLQIGDWVEIADDHYTLRNEPSPLVKIDTLYPSDQIVRLSAGRKAGVGEDAALHPLLRRWDQQAGQTNRGAPELLPDGALRLREGVWLTLEDGVQIKFEAAPKGTDAHIYRPGDYWLIPARTATGDVIWPQQPDNKGPLSRPPHGVEHHYAPLALVATRDGQHRLYDLRSKFTPLINHLHS